MSNQEAIALLRNLEDSLDSYCELNEEGKTAFRMAIEALSCSEFPNSSDTIYRQTAIAHAVPLNLFGREVMMVSASELENLPPAQPEQRYTEEELRVFQHGISLSLLSKRSAQHWQYDENTATEIKFLERLYDKVVADMGDEQDG